MNEYHICWILKENPKLTTGKNFKGNTMEEALNSFKEEFSDIEPLYIIKK